MNDELERMWKEEVWPNSRGYPIICLEGLRKNTKNLSHNSRSPDRDLNPGPHQYEVGATRL
jgi:hypothetical protein